MKQALEVAVVRFIIELHPFSAVDVEVDQLFRQPVRDVRDLGFQLLLGHQVVLLPPAHLGRDLDSQPGQLAFAEVHHHVCQRFEVVSSALLHHVLRVRTREAGSSDEASLLLEWDVEACVLVDVRLGQSEVDNVQLLSFQAALLEVLNRSQAVFAFPTCVELR